MESLSEQLIIYGIVGLFFIVVLLIYVRKLKRESQIVDEKIDRTKIHVAEILNLVKQQKVEGLSYHFNTIEIGSGQYEFMSNYTL